MLELTWIAGAWKSELAVSILNFKKTETAKRPSKTSKQHIKLHSTSWQYPRINYLGSDAFHSKYCIPIWCSWLVVDLVGGFFSSEWSHVEQPKNWNVTINLQHNSVWFCIKNDGILFNTDKWFLKSFKNYKPIKNGTNK